MKAFFATLLCVFLCSTPARACAYIDGRCLSSVGHKAWIEMPRAALDYLRSQEVNVTGGTGNEPLRLTLNGKTFEIQPADVRSAQVWLVEGDDPRDKAVVFVLESRLGVRQVCDIATYGTERLWHHCRLSLPGVKPH